MSYVVERAEIVPSNIKLRRLLLIVNAISLMLTLPFSMFIAFWILIEPLVRILSLTLLAYAIAVINSFIIIKKWKSLPFMFLVVAVMLNVASSLFHFLHWQ
ncbi:MAG TPA: hypothetical protein DEF47_17210 [Herpetosiphon sp.]|uniref:hypothetical protein n=1 Tax=Herpetosiphon sp. TaxID=71864 RepID=UPI00059BF9D2|nr:hypothetical protein [Herpetosiphon sp.]HBW51634.1 hypothetical protein [Herpetosiphon sp.]